MRWTKPAAIVANTDPHTKPGSHWVAMYLNNLGHCIYFDSYGEPPAISHHLKRIQKNSRTYSWNKKHLQSLGSRVCGQYCVMFLHYMTRGYSLEKFCKMFSSDLKRNDQIVEKFYNRIRGVHRKKIKNNYNYSPHKGNGKIRIQNCKPKLMLIP